MIEQLWVIIIILMISDIIITNISTNRGNIEINPYNIYGKFILIGSLSCFDYISFKTKNKNMQKGLKFSMFFIIFLFSFGFMWNLFVSNVSAEVRNYTYYSTEDTALGGGYGCFGRYADTRNTNYGTNESTAFVFYDDPSNYCSGGLNPALYKFDITTIPSFIINYSINFYTEQTISREFSLYSTTNNWTELGSTYNNFNEIITLVNISTFGGGGSMKQIDITDQYTLNSRNNSFYILETSGNQNEYWRFREYTGTNNDPNFLIFYESCGDNVCDGSEDISNCFADCGSKGNKWCGNNMTLIENISIYIDGNLSYIEIPINCQNGCDNITSTCKEENQFYNVLFIVIVIVFASLGLIVYKVMR